MTKRLYYDQPDLLEFDSVVEEASAASAEGSRPAVMLRETAFYPTSGGQVHDTGWITLSGRERLRVAEVAEMEDGRVVHYIEAPALEAPVLAAEQRTGTASHPVTRKARVPRTADEGVRSYVGAAVHGSIDPERRCDHMQQHTGQHVLSAAFVELYQMPTVSFHMGDDYCSIDLATAAVSPGQVAGAEKRANEIIFENRLVGIRYVSRAEAEKLGLRKLPPAERDELRLIEVADFDLSACGGTHVNSTGQIGSILLRKIEKTRQGVRVEFVCGGRAVRMARRDYGALTEAAALFSAQIWDVPNQIRKSFDGAKFLRKQRDDTLEELAEAMARQAIGSSGDRVIGPSDTGFAQSLVAPPAQLAIDGRKIIVRIFSDRDVSFAKLFAQKATRAGAPVIALVASTIDPPGMVFAQTPGGTGDMGVLLKQALSPVGGRGGGGRDFAQGGVPAGCDVEQLLRRAAGTIGG